VLLSGHSTHVHTRAGTLPVELPYEDIFPGLHALEIIIIDSDGEVAYVIIPYFIRAGMKEIVILLKIAY